MEDQFVPYELAVKLKELGFNEECLARYCVVTEWEKPTGEVRLQISSDCPNNHKTLFKAPLWQQAFTSLLRNLKNRELIVALEFDGEVTLWEVITEDTYETYNKILASGNKESLEKLIELCSQLRKEVKS